MVERWGGELSEVEDLVDGGEDGTVETTGSIDCQSPHVIVLDAGGLDIMEGPLGGDGL